ncbi:MAG: KOW domain-containing RNA-binding protein [Firmicutes bacterium]|nr:KOW domain-containing RNA-binding protein [Bacillota bacterium]MBR0105062.1 KOW domain-containing RNA-binding protein [Bacillota bacterium]MBR2594097.1 KOW domain-containing RNA-binding protein [Bacillota bacterium]
MEITPGQVVYSKCGRDKGGAFIVISAEDGYVYIADGKTRKLEKPKRKKVKHIQPTKYVFAEIKEKVINEGYLLDADLRKALSKITHVKA